MYFQKKNPAVNGASKYIESNFKNNTSNNQYNFREINAAAISALPALLTRWLPDGCLRGYEYMARNPRRDDQKLGSFSINTRTGKWADFATGDKGGDVISLAAYLSGKSQYEAACELAKMLGVRHD